MHTIALGAPYFLKVYGTEAQGLSGPLLENSARRRLDAVANRWPPNSDPFSETCGLNTGSPRRRAPKGIKTRTDRGETVSSGSGSAAPTVV
jgi:hypothetical protein